MGAAEGVIVIALPPNTTHLLQFLFLVSSKYNRRKWFNLILQSKAVQSKVEL